MTDVARGPSLGRFLVIVLLLVILAIVAVWGYNKTHIVTAGEHVGNAIDAMPAAVSKVADEATDKGNLDKVGDAVKDTGQTASSALSKAGKATSSAVSATSADVKAASDKQKEQNAEHKHTQ
jgi:hypothetical protein